MMFIASSKFDAFYQIHTVCSTPPKGGSANHTKASPLPLLPETNTTMFTKVTMYHTLLSDQALGWKDGSYGTYAACSLDDDPRRGTFYFSIPPVCEDEIEKQDACGQPRTPEAGDNNSM